MSTQALLCLSPARYPHVYRATTVYTWIDASWDWMVKSEVYDCLASCRSVWCDVLQGIAPELVKQENLLHSIAAALHLSSQPITGQTATPAQLQRNPAVSVNVEQPLMQVSWSLSSISLCPLPSGRGVKRCCDPSVCLSVPCPYLKNGALIGNVNRTLIENAMLPRRRGSISIVPTGWRHGVVGSGVRRINELTSGPVSTWMGDRLRAAIPSRYVTSQLGQLSLAVPPGSLNRLPVLAGVRVGMSALSGGR